MKKIIALFAILIALSPGLLSAQAAKQNVKAQAILEYSDDETQLVITDARGNPLVPTEGLILPVGAVIKTLKTTAEIRLTPNGSIIKLSVATSFKIEGLKEADGTGNNDFAILSGKIRTVAAKLAGSTVPGYNIRTPTANAGVRGTDFAMKYDAAAKLDWVCVQEGRVDFTNITTGATVPVAAGQFANTFDSVFAAGAVDAARLAELFSDVGFVKLDPLAVPSQPVASVTQPAPSSSTPAATETPAAAPAGDDPFMEFLKKVFGLEVGSVTIDGTTYSKAVVSPVVAFDSFKLGLYLPIVYTNDMFDPDDWYRPAGNNEWSFGSDKSGLTNQVADFATDLALKIKFLEWGVQGVDPYYIKVGNLKTMSIGHGTVVRNFANDQDFPAIRKIGLNAGAKLGVVSLEGLADDLSSPSVVGGRIAFDLVGDQVVLGFQTTADLDLANDQSMAMDPAFASLDSSDLGDPILLVGGLDLQLFKIDGGAAFRTVAFADVNTLAAYVQEEAPFFNLDKGFNTTTIWHDGQLGSLGGEAGVYGNIAIVNYRLSFQAERGLYSNGIFQGNYYRTRNTTLLGLVGYLADETIREDVDSELSMGIFGSAGADLFGMVTFEAAYRFPMVLKDDGSLGFGDRDYLKLRVDLPKGKVPVVDVGGSISYERTGFVASIRDNVNLFDVNTVLRGEVIYGLVKGLDLAIGVSTSVLRDSDGNVVYEDAMPKVGPTISIDTRLSF